MGRVHYSRRDLSEALARLPLESGDVLFCHSNLGFFGRMEDAGDVDNLCATFVAEILKRISPGGTLVVPTFTYSFPRGEIFDLEKSPSNMGVFAEWIRRQPNALRSQDPCYSIAAIGARADELACNAPINSFSETSFFGRFFNLNGKVLNLNFDAASTFIHFVERQLKVPYRFDKTFKGIIRAGGTEHATENTIWVRYLSDDALEFAADSFDEVARKGGHFVSRPVGRGEIGCISARATFDLIERTLPLRPWFLTRADKLGVTSPQIIAE